MSEGNDNRGAVFSALVEEAADNVAMQVRFYRLLVELRDLSTVWSSDHEDYRRQLLIIHLRLKQVIRDMEAEAEA